MKTQADVSGSCLDPAESGFLFYPPHRLTQTVRATLLGRNAAAHSILDETHGPATLGPCRRSGASHGWRSSLATDTDEVSEQLVRTGTPPSTDLTPEHHELLPAAVQFRFSDMAWVHVVSGRVLTTT